MNWHYIEHCVAILGVLSMLLHALEAGCNAAGWTKYEGIFQKLGAFVEGFMGQIKPPKAGGSVACAFILLFAINASADTIPSAKSGIIYAPQTNQSIAVNTVKVATVKMVDINAGMARTNGVAVTASIDMSTIKASWLTLPVLDLVNYMNVGVGCAKFSGDTGVACGPYTSISWKF